MSIHQQSIYGVAGGVGTGIAIIRVSGATCHREVQPLLSRAVSDFRPRELTRVTLLDPERGKLDEILAAFFFAGNSFTGENSLELHCHGSPFVIQETCKNLHTLGIRQGTSGEFTRRAFLNGRLDLTTAEGINALVRANTDSQWRAARDLASGRLQAYIEGLRAMLIESLSHLNAIIDFPDEADVVNSTHRFKVGEIVKQVSQQVEQLRGTYSQGRIAANGLRVALIGPPNSGKSSLLNRLLDMDRAIVSEIPGTTRDYLEEPFMIQGRLFRAIDTAGIRDSADKIESLGIDRAKALADECDLTLRLFAADFPEVSAGYQPSGVVLNLISKIDLGSPLWEGEIESAIAISALTGEGIKNLEDRLIELCDESQKTMAETPLISIHRQLMALDNATAGLAKFWTSYEGGDYPECLAFEVQDVLSSLVEIIGSVDGEVILDNIFKNFCVGK
jgi:tRNA modification GTPase